MSTYTSEPGTRLAGRYRLVDQMSAGTGWTFWKATDEPLARSVTVLTFAAGFPRIAEAITAARAASRLGDPRFSKVFDVEDADELAYVVLEWVVGESLLDLLADGPLDSPRAVSLLSEAARAIAAAHEAGLAHLRLNPACLYWTRGSGVKITGLGIDAVLAGTTPGTAGDGAEDGESPELTDTRDLGRLLYAALTGYWPGPQRQEADELAEAAEPGDTPGPAEPAGLPPAPEADGVPCTPRQVSAAIPANIDAVTCQALFQQPTHDGPALSTPALLAEALADVATPDPPPAPAALSSGPPTADRGYRPNATTGSYPAGDPVLRPRTAVPYRRPPADRSSPRTAIISVLIVLVLAAAGVVGWALNHRGTPAASGPPTRGASSSASSSSPSAAATVVLTPVGANSFDVYGNDGGNEDGAGAKYAIDNNPTTFWHTDYYLNHPVFGNLKTGTGLILDMGKQVRLSQVVVQFAASCCADVEIEIGNNNTPVPSSLSTFTEVASSTSAQGTTTFNVTSNATGRYVLIWLTRLPPLTGSPGEYEAQIYNVVVHGPAVSQSG
jgi:F5/8 type C domain